jgi:hypothetical protein
MSLGPATTVTPEVLAMKPLPCAILLLATLAFTARAADEPKPNTLTPKEAAEGWILLFDGETAFGWDGEAKVDQGALVIGGAKDVRLRLTSAFDQCVLEGEWRLEGSAASATWSDRGRIEFGEVNDGPAWGRLSLTVKERSVDKLVEGGAKKSRTRVIDAFRGEMLPRTPMPPTQPTFNVRAGSKLFLRNLKLKPTNMTSLFNGKDLAGWKKYTADGKRVKTEFSVTDQGWLHLKNGPGDIQTEGRYDDFVLQLECRTNGKQLNSGVFFRCIPGDYQNGYEAQIHNGFDADKPKEYAVEEFDPKTNELKEKKKVKSSATDYGTGAIYRRVPARRQAAKDNEWFTMTVAAQGRHIATWVNGVQTVDWTDNRPLNDNPRNGCRLEKGGISLQGHDPTTDIDFRNIRIAEVPKPAN